MANILIGEVYYPNEGGSVTILEKVKPVRSLVKFNDEKGYEYVVRDADIKRGMMKNPYKPRYFGVGYLGVGEHKTSISGKQNPVHQVWSNMVARCFSDKRKYYYKDCTLHTEWLDFQVFAEWYELQIGCDSGYELDKDLMYSGNKHYSPKTCCLLPRDINQALSIFYKKDSYLKAGVSVRKSGTYRYKISKGGKAKFSKPYKTEMEAFHEYVKEKEIHIKELANAYKEKLCPLVYERLLTWRLIDTSNCENTVDN